MGFAECFGGGAFDRAACAAAAAAATSASLLPSPLRLSLMFSTSNCDSRAICRSRAWLRLETRRVSSLCFETVSREWSVNVCSTGLYTTSSRDLAYRVSRNGMAYSASGRGRLRFDLVCRCMISAHELGSATAIPPTPLRSGP